MANMRILRHALFAASLCSGSITVAQGAILLDNSAQMDFQSSRPAGFSPLAAITVASPASINQIGAMVDLGSAGNLEFLIFDLGSSTLLFNSGPIAYADTGLNFKVSPVFSDFTLDPGITYGIGAIADVDGLWGTNNTSSGNPFTQNGITVSDDLNGNANNFASPALVGNGSAMIIIELAGGGQSVPEPGSILLLALGLAGLVFARAKYAG